MVSFINLTGSIGQVYTGINNNLTGSEFITLLLAIMLIMLFFLMFRIPLEASAVLVLPLIIICMAYTSNLFILGGVFLIYLGVLLAKNYFIG